MKTLLCAPQRTAIGSFQGALNDVAAPQLGGIALRASLERSGVDPARVDEVYMGCVLTAGLGQAPARQAALAAGLSNKVPATTVGKVCGSGLKSVMLGDLSIRSGENQVVLVGGMESMSQSPYLLPKLRGGLRLGNGKLIDSMIKDGLWDVYNDFHMGSAGELCAREHQISREAQDEYARSSYTRALEAQKKKLFKSEISPLEIKGKKGSVIFDSDEEPARSDLEKFASLKPVFDTQGTITAANASTLNDGAAALLLCSEQFAKAEKVEPMAQIIAQAQSAHAPEWFTTAPAASIEALLKKAGLRAVDIDVWEINEAFSCVALVNMKLLNLDPARVNVRGGAVALGHPIGASGSRILVTLAHILKDEKKRYGVASLCLGGGEAVSVLIENLCR